MTEVEAKRITTLLVAAYPGWKPSEATMQLYERLLRPLSAALAEQAVLEIIRSEREFAPPVGAICYRAACMALLRSGEGTLSAEEAWAELSAAIRARGSYRAPSFNNSALARAVAAMNWREICANPNVEATRAHFFRLFTAFQQGRIVRRLDELSAGPGMVRVGPDQSMTLADIKTARAGAPQAEVDSKRRDEDGTGPESGGVGRDRDDAGG